MPYPICEGLSHRVYEGVTGHYERQSPETISTIMEGGSPASIFYAAKEWRRVHDEMSSGVVKPLMQLLKELPEQWIGLSATRMDDATASFLKWLTELEKQLETTRNMTSYIGLRFRKARRSVVPLRDIRENREQRVVLAATGLAVDNAPQIAFLEYQYDTFWESDVEAMRAYDASVSNALAAMTPWQSPPPITSGA